MGRIAVIASALAALGISIATLFTLGNRIDALERYLDSVASGLSNALSTALQALGLGRENAREIKALNQTTNYLKDITSATERDLRKAESNIKDLGAGLASANSNIQKLNREMTSANADISRLSREISSASTKINTLIKDLNSVANTVGKLESDLRSAKAEISRLSEELKKANAEISRVVSGISSANAKNQSISNDLKTAQMRIRQNAETSASARDAATTNRQEITNLNNEVHTGIVVKSWSPTVWEPVITNSYTQLRSEVRNISVQEASNQIQKTFADVSNDIQSKLNTSDFQKALQTDAGLQDLRRRLGTVETKTASIPTVTSQTTSTSTPILTSDITNLKDRIREQERTTTNLQTRVSEQERVNSTAVTMLGGISSKLDNIPIAAAGLVIPFIPTTRTIENAAAAGTCRTTKGDGCLASTVANAENAAKNALDNNTLLNGINTLIGGGNLALIEQTWRNTLAINAKLGAEIRGGVSGYLKGIGNFVGSSRILEIITAAGVLHNAWMLSGNIASTYFQIVDAIVNIPTMIINPNGEKISSEAIFGQTFKLFISETIGLKAWSEIEAEAKALNNIINTSANVWQGIQQITNDTQQLCNQARNYVAQLGNALEDEGVIGEDNWDYKDLNKQVKSSHMSKIQKMADGLQAIDNGLQAINMVTQTFTNIIEQGHQLKDNFETIELELNKANLAAKELSDEAIKNIKLPEFSLEDLY